MTEIIEIADLVFTYPQAATPALRDVSLRIESGAFVLLAGPSGAGKSTLLRALNGLVPHFSGGVVRGHVVVDGIDVLTAGPTVAGTQVGFVFQTPEAQAVLDRVEPEIAFALENAALPPDEMEQRVDATLALLDLIPLRNRALRTLSGGERQRVAIASAMALEPRVLVLDEPTSQLDPQSAESLLQALKRLNETLGLTIVLAEHRLDRVLPFVDRVIVMDKGAIVADGPTRAVLPQLPHLPPLQALGGALGWRPLPLTLAQGRALAPALPSVHVPRAADARQQARPVLQVDRAAVAYGATTVVRDVSFDVAAGELVALIGRNGAGKSTLLRAITGLTPLQAGTIAVDGASIAGRSVASICQSVAYLPQNPDDLLFADSAEEELWITLRNHALADAPPTAPGDLLNELGIASLADRYPRDLSVGQRQRIALAAVLITRPPLLLLDEPTRGIDPAAKDELAALLRRWRADGIAILLVTHDVELVAQVADRVIILDNGAVQAMGDSAETMARFPAFAPQMMQLFPQQRWLTVADALRGLRDMGVVAPEHAMRHR